MTIIKTLAKDTVVYGGADLVSKLIAFFSFPIFAAVLNPSSSGVLDLILTATRLLGLFLNFGLNNAVQRFYWDHGVDAMERSAIVTTGLFLLCCLGLLILVVGLSVVPWLTAYAADRHWPVSGIALVSALLLLVFSQITGYSLDILRLHFLPWRFIALSFTSRMAGVILSLIAVVAWEMGVDGLLAAQALGMIFIAPLSILVIAKDLSLMRVSLKWLKELANFGYPFIFTGLAFWLFGALDRWMLASMASIEEVGTYSVAFRFASVLTFVVSAFAQAWSPHAIKIKTENPKSYRKIYGHILVSLLALMTVVGGSLALFSGELIGLMMPASYRDSALPLIILTLGIIIQSTQQITAIGISIERKTSLFTKLVSVALVFNALLNFVLIPRFGAAGAAWATLAAYLLLSAMYFFATQKIHPLEIEWCKLALFVMLAIGVTAVAINLLTFNFNWHLVLVKLLVVAVCTYIAYKHYLFIRKYYAAN